MRNGPDGLGCGSTPHMGAARKGLRRVPSGRGWAGNGESWRGSAGQVRGSPSGCRSGSIPDPGAARKRLWCDRPRLGAVWHGTDRYGAAVVGMDGRSDGRRQGSTPCPSTARKGYWRGEVWSGEASRVGARPGEASRGKSWGALLADTGVQVPGAHGPQGLKECSGREWKGFSWNSRVWPRTWRKPRR